MDYISVRIVNKELSKKQRRNTMISFDKLIDRRFETELNAIKEKEAATGDIDHLMVCIFNYLKDKYYCREGYKYWSIEQIDRFKIKMQKYDPFEGRSRILEELFIETDEDLNISCYKLNKPVNERETRLHSRIVKLDHVSIEEITKKCAAPISNNNPYDFDEDDIPEENKRINIDLIGINFYELYHGCQKEERGLLSKLLMEHFNVPSLSCFDLVIPAYAFYKYDALFYVPGDKIYASGGFCHFTYEKRDTIVITNPTRGIEEHAFDGCTKLKEIYLCSNVERIEKHAFVNCPGLIIHCAFKNKPVGWDDEWCDGSCKVMWDSPHKGPII